MAQKNITFQQPGFRNGFFMRIAFFVEATLFCLEVTIDRQENCISWRVKHNDVEILHLDYNNRNEAEQAADSITNESEYHAFCTQVGSTPTGATRFKEMADLGITIHELIEAVHTQIPEDYFVELENPKYDLVSAEDVEAAYREHEQTN